MHTSSTVLGQVCVRGSAIRHATTRGREPLETLAIQICAPMHYTLGDWSSQKLNGKHCGCSTLQMASRVTEGQGGPASLADWWVRRARVALPHLHVAADDALLTFGEALQRTLQSVPPSAPDARCQCTIVILHQAKQHVHSLDKSACDARILTPRPVSGRTCHVCHSVLTVDLARLCSVLMQRPG